MGESKVGLWFTTWESVWGLCGFLRICREEEGRGRADVVVVIVEEVRQGKAGEKVRFEKKEDYCGVLGGCRGEGIKYNTL